MDKVEEISSFFFINISAPIIAAINSNNTNIMGPIAVCIPENIPEKGAPINAAIINLLKFLNFQN